MNARHVILGLALCAVLGQTTQGTQALPPGQGPPPRGTVTPPTGTGMIAGRVLDADSGQGIAGAFVQINLARPGGAAVGLVQASFPAVLTDSQGRYVYTALPAGTFIGSARQDGYTTTILQRTVDLTAGAQIRDFNFQLTRFNTVVGTVRDDVGDPVPGTEVIAYVRSAFQGRPVSLSASGRARTDDRGEYRLNNLRAGQYMVCACMRDPIPFDGQLLTTLAARPLDLLSVGRRAAVVGSEVAALDSTLRTYAPTFYPDTTLASRAEHLRLEKGETRTGVDITVTTVRAVRVSGQIIGVPASGISAAHMWLHAAGDLPEARSITQVQPVLVQPDGRFDFARVTPGAYVLEVNLVVGAPIGSPTGSALAFLGARGMPPPPAPPPPPSMAPPQGRAGGAMHTPREILWATETIVVGDGDVTGLAIPIQPSINVRGKVEFAGSAPRPAFGSFSLAAMESRPNKPSQYGAQLNADGTFGWAVPPGRYIVLASMAAPWAHTRSVTVKGVDVLDAPFTVETDIADMVVTVSDIPRSTMSGTVELPAGEVPEEWAVLIFSSDRRTWKEPYGAVRKFVAARVTSQRTFTTPIPPGDYLLALSRGVPLDWIDAPALEELAKGATSVSLAEGEQKQVQVKR